MLIGLHPLLSPPLLLALAEMGHGDAIAIVDANFPAAGTHTRVIRIDGADAEQTLAAVLTVMPIDTFIPDPVVFMQVADRPDDVPPVVHAFRRSVAETGAKAGMVSVNRHAFYERARRAFAVVVTGERRLYGNIIVTKGVVRPEA